MKKINGVQVPNPHTTNPPEIGDKVKVSSGEFAGMVGEVVEISEDVKNLITKIKIINLDNKIQYIETKEVVLEVWDLVEKVIKSNLFKKVWKWIKNIFKKKKKN